MTIEVNQNAPKPNSLYISCSIFLSILNKILRYLNSLVYELADPQLRDSNQPFFGCPIASVLRRWLSLLTFSQLAADHPRWCRGGDTILRLLNWTLCSPWPQLEKCRTQSQTFPTGTASILYLCQSTQLLLCLYKGWMTQLPSPKLHTSAVTPKGFPRGRIQKLFFWTSLQRPGQNPYELKEIKVTDMKYRYKSHLENVSAVEAHCSPVQTSLLLTGNGSVCPHIPNDPVLMAVK